jgi:ADP-heptose:LPS heptosyltransferase
MTSPSQDYALLLAAATAVDAELAKELLESEGIPVLLHGLDRDFAELGAAVHMQVSHPDVYVPKTALDKAVEILRRTWADFAPPE